MDRVSDVEGVGTGSIEIRADGRTNSGVLHVEVIVCGGALRSHSSGGTLQKRMRKESATGNH